MEFTTAEYPGPTLSPAQEEKARQIHQESTVFIAHDHQILAGDMELMARGGVTAKHLQISLDGQAYADRETYLSSVPADDRRKELQRIAPDRWRTLMEEEAPFLMKGGPTGFLRRALTTIDYVHWQVANSGGRIRIAAEPHDIVEAKESGQVALLLGSEGSRLIEGRLEVVRMLYALGLRELGISWAFRTEAGSPQGDETGSGLTTFGRNLVKELNRLGMIIDVDHLSIASIEDVLEESEAPVLASHAAAAALNPNAACCYEDGLIRDIASQGGVIAIHFMSQQVKPGRNQATLDELIRQFAYVADLVGADHVACGPDYVTPDPRQWENQHISTPFTYARGVEDPSRIFNLTRGLVHAGFDADEIQSILGGSLLRLFERVREMAQPTHDVADPQVGELGSVSEGITPL